jgi:hypothetical protein
VIGKHAIAIKSIDGYEMIGRIYRCNIVGSHLVMSNRYPLVYLSISYQKPMVNGSLLQIFISMDMSERQKKQIKKNSQYINLRIRGKWVRHIDMDDEVMQNLDKMLETTLEDQATKLFYSDEYKTINGKSRDDMDEDEIVTWIEEYISKEKVFYKDLVSDQPYEFRKIETARDYFINLCQSPRFYSFLRIAMACRLIHRRKEGNLDEDSSYVIPKHVTNIRDLRQEMIDSGELTQ